MKRLSLLVPVVLFAGFVASSPAQETKINSKVEFFNTSSEPVTFAVCDLEPRCRVAVKGGSCWIKVPAGKHFLIGKKDDGTVAATRNVNLEANGTFTWTIY